MRLCPGGQCGGAALISEAWTDSALLAGLAQLIQPGGLGDVIFVITETHLTGVYFKLRQITDRSHSVFIKLLYTWNICAII